MNKLDGKVVTFYSYKGGVGRSFLLSNTATLLAQWGYKVLCIDWDLEAPGLHYYFRPHMQSPETGLVEMVLGARDGHPVDALGHITPVIFPDDSRLDLIAAGGAGGDYVPNVQGIDWDALYEEQDFGNVLEEWRRRWIESYDVVFVDSRTGISDSGGICTAQLPHILAYAFTANQQNVDGVLDVVTRAARARNGLPYDRSRLLTLPLLCRFDMSEEYERAAEWKGKLHPSLKSSYNAWVPEGAAVERVLDHCTVPYSAYWSFGEELPVLTEDFRNPQLISHSIASIAGLIARNLEDVQLFTESRDSYVDAAIRTGRRGGRYPYDFFISSAANTSEDARILSGLLAAEGFSSYSLPTDMRPGGRSEDLRTVIDTCRHFILLGRDTVGSFQQGELNYFLRQTLDEQADRVLFPVLTPRNVVRDLPTIVQSIQAFSLSDDGLADVARTIRARIQGNGSPSAAPGYGGHPPDKRLFVSYAGADRAWAEWVAWQLAEAGYEVELGGQGRSEQGRTVALFSRAYFEADWSITEAWITDLAARERLVPVRIDAVNPPSALRTPAVADLFEAGEEEARARLLQTVAGPLRPSSTPAFPGGTRSRRSGETEPRLPGSLPRVWNAPPRNANFTGREDLLGEMRTRLTDARTVLSLSGQIGVGKTHLAIEYAHRFSGEYDQVWWVDAEHSQSVPAQLASLAMAIGCANPDTPEPLAVQNLSMELRTLSRWLIVFDNAQEPAALALQLPTGDGHVLITSRNPHWHQIATPVDVDVLSRAESTALLRSGSQSLSKLDAHQLAEALGDLPLALTQAAESLYIFTPDQFLQELERYAGTALSDGTPLDYPGSLTDQLTSSMDRLKEQDPSAAALLRACTLLAPEPFPLHTCDPEQVERSEHPAGIALVRELSYPRAFRRILTALERLGLARVAGGSIQVHRLTQAVLRDHLRYGADVLLVGHPNDEATQAAHDANALLASAYPGQAADPDSWSRWPDLVPHLLAITPDALTSPFVRYAACEACWYLMDHGGARVALPRLRDLHQAWTQQFGAVAEETMWAAAYLARAYAETGEYSQARDLEADILARHQQVLGQDHPDTLRTAGDLAICLEALGRAEEARDLATDTLDRQRRVLGEDHPDTLRTAGNLAVYLEALGETDHARDLAEDTLNRQRRVLGEDHPDTRHTVDNLVDGIHTVRAVHRPNTPPTGSP
ncbi:tetratricopeptide repeat protein [Streptomyces sp. S3(2020)]|uniref:FxSxx-COOH system tetratricopeptide repeat protein n=1 Tax=Streptomyces sp. S3(2020) TaxID=2732044 RepID=UPI001489D798|nr:FxSxx-COOH system tetratricopeptide repeat protein [Streptomyces sp. S3(2020)]NNN36847.1 tetratricopeptide repeat protein [Streptomyces sp. S3(2020)]